LLGRPIAIEVIDRFNELTQKAAAKGLS
jgi:hypothetical protein